MSGPPIELVRMPEQVGPEQVGPRTFSAYVHAKVESVGNKNFAQIAIVIQVALILLFAIGADYNSDLSASSMHKMGFLYTVYQDVHVMILVGFGFLMTFLSKYGFSSVGFNFMISAFVIQFAIITNGIWHMAYDSHWQKIHLNIETMITADFAAGAVLITFGGVLGKVSPIQLVIIAIVECVVYGLNEMIGARHFGAVDMGGSIFVHTVSVLE